MSTKISELPAAAALTGSEGVPAVQARSTVQATIAQVLAYVRGQLANIATSGSASDLTSGTLPAAQLPTPTPSTLGGIKSLAAATSMFLTGIGADGSPTKAQPLFSDISGVLSIAQLPGLTSTYVWVGNGSGVATAVSVSGDGTLSNAGVLSITKTGGTPFGPFATGTNAANLTGVVGSANGGAGTASGVLKANGSGTVSAAAAGTDFVAPGGALGTPSSGTLTNCTGLPEAGLTLADNSTANVSTTKHGFAPKAPNDATKYLDGTGAYSVPAPAQCRAWANWSYNSGTNTITVNASFNVASVTRSSTGQFLVTFTNAAPAANGYAVTVTGDGGPGCLFTSSSYLTSSFLARSSNSSSQAYQDVTFYSAAAFW